MPRRTYDHRNGRRRATTNQGEALMHLAAEMATSRPCVVCGLSLPPRWRYPEHAGCLPANQKRNFTERNNL